jgi:cell division protein FtsW
MLYSASSYEAQIHGKKSTYYLFRQLVFVGGGFVAMFIVSRIPYKIYNKFSLPIYVISILLIFLVLTPLGITANGASRWVNLGFASFHR